MGVPPYPAMTIATWFISRASAAEQEPSSLRLHMLLGRAQGHYRARYGRPLLAEPVSVYPPGGPAARPAGPAASTSGARLTGPAPATRSPGTTSTPPPPASSARLWDSYGGRFADVKRW